VYGLLTESAVKGFQSSHQIEINGQADQETMETLLYKEKKKKISAIEEIIHTIDYGEKSENVREVQELLLYYGYYEGDIDGIYGPLTENSITQIKSEGLLQTNKAHTPTSTEDTDQDTHSSAETSTTNMEKNEEDNSKINERNNTKNIRHVETKDHSTSLIQEA